jgi:hypothetical protein
VKATNHQQELFPIKYKSTGKLKNDWNKQGIKASCKCKSSRYIYSRNSNDPNTKAFNIKYCKILNNFVKEAMRQHYNRFQTVKQKQHGTWLKGRQENYM